jgi:hypothetical protein
MEARPIRQLEWQASWYPPSVLGWFSERPRRSLVRGRSRDDDQDGADNPSVFFAICARLIGPEVKLTIEQSLPGNLSARDWAIMREIVDAVKTAVPDATNRRAGEVLEYVRSRLIDSAENALAERGCLGAIRHPPSRSFTHGSNALAAPLRHARQRPRWHFSTRISKCARCGYPRFLENAASWEI